MDPLLKKLQESSSVCHYTITGGYLHADDIRTLAKTCGSLEKQAAIVTHFVEENFMKLNAKKCEVVGFGKFGNVSCTVDGSCMTVRDVGKCLGFWIC